MACVDACAVPPTHSTSSGIVCVRIQCVYLSSGFTILGNQCGVQSFAEGTPVENTLALAVASADAIAFWISCAQAAATACALLLVAFATASANACPTELPSVSSQLWHPSGDAAMFFISEASVCFSTSRSGSHHANPLKNNIQTCLGSSSCRSRRGCACIRRSKSAACKDNIPLRIILALDS